MAEAGVPHPDGPRPEPRTPDGSERAARARSGRDPVALAAWRRVAEQRRRSAGTDDVELEPVEPAVGTEPVVEAVVPARLDVPEPALPSRSGPPDGVPVVRDPAGDAPREPLAGRPGDVAASPGVRPDDGPPAPGRLHEVLLGLAGRIDDDALTAVREMVAAEDDAEAAELLGGCLLADEVGLSADERGVLAPWFATARVDPDLLSGLPVDPDALRRSGHRFVPTTTGATPAATLARAARRLSGVLSVRESWRVTPAGAAPGPVPHRVVLVETADPDDCDHVVHHLAHAARGLGGTSVEVFAAGVALPAYHRDALAAARPLSADPLPTRGQEAVREDVVREEVVREEVVREDGETWRTVADAGAARMAPPQAPDRRPAVEPPASEPVAAAEPVVEPEVEPTVDVDPEVTEPSGPEATAAPTSIDDDLSLTARRIAALWARPVPEDFSAPLPPESLERTRLEPPGDPDAGSVPDGPSAAVDRADEDELGDLEDVDEPADLPEETGTVVDGPAGRHGRGPAVDPGTDAFPARPPRPTPYVNGHHLGEQPADVADPPHEVDPGEPTPPEGTAVDPADATAQVQRARHSRGRGEEPETPARSGHDARFGAGPGPAWPGAPVTGDRPGPDTLFTSPVEIGEEPVTLGTNGHRHDAVAAVPAEPVDPPTGPVSWSSAPRPGPGAPVDDASGPRPVGDVAPPWAAADGSAWPQEQPGWPPAPAPVPPAYRPPQESPVTPPETTGGWSPDTDDSVAQLSDRERELLARLHEELAQRERAEGTDPFAGPSGRPQPPRPAGPPPERRNGQGPPPGRTNGHGLPGGPDPAS
jgi:hypothetical protein